MKQIFSIFITAMLLSMTGCSAFSPSTALLEEAHNAVKDGLKDPRSAAFQDDAVFVFPDKGIVCNGKVNSRNSYGGWTGFQQYLYERGIGVALDEQASAEVDHEKWMTLMDHCSKAIGDQADRIMQSVNAHKLTK